MEKQDEHNKMVEALNNIKKLREAQTERTEVINKTEKPNSIEMRIGQVGSSFKLYFKDSEDLMEQLTAINKRMNDITLNLSEIKQKWAERNI